MSELEVLYEFKNTLISFMDELIDQFPEEGELIRLRIYLKDQCNISDVLENFIYKIIKDDNKLRELIKQRDEEFFLVHSIIDENDKNIEKISHFRKLWRSGRLENEDKQTVWRWIDSFIYLSDKYSKLK